MVLAYDCPEHGWHSECDVSESGERICPEGADTAVTGITGTTRAPDHTDGGNAHYSGNIDWLVKIGYSGPTIYVSAHDYTDALDKAVEHDARKPGEKAIREVKPAERSRRRRL